MSHSSVISLIYHHEKEVFGGLLIRIGLMFESNTRCDAMLRPAYLTIVNSYGLTANAFMTIWSVRVLRDNL